MGIMQVSYALNSKDTLWYKYIVPLGWFYSLFKYWKMNVVKVAWISFSGRAEIEQNAAW